jgi:hypothetical protein
VIVGSLGPSDTRTMFERYGHLFDHTATPNLISKSYTITGEVDIPKAAPRE